MRADLWITHTQTHIRLHTNRGATCDGRCGACYLLGHKSRMAMTGATFPSLVAGVTMRFGAVSSALKLAPVLAGKAGTAAAAFVLNTPPAMFLGRGVIENKHSTTLNRR